MKGYDNHLYLTLAIISSVVALVQLMLALYLPRLARWSFVLLFGWACIVNWQTAVNEPSAYLKYADLTWSSAYAHFTNGWFSRHILLVVGTIATCQGLIAISMLAKGSLFRAGALGAMAFLLSIIPLGVGSGFPCSAIMAIAMVILVRDAPVYAGMFEGRAARDKRLRIRHHRVVGH